MIVRPLGPGDAAALSELVDADRLPGQPACTPARVTSVLDGRSRSNAWWWEQLTGHRTVGLESADGGLVGAGAVGRGPEGHPRILWLHAREDPSVLDPLLFNLLRGVRRIAPAYAFSFGTDLAFAVEGLPRTRRTATHDALTAKGFSGRDRWLYLSAGDPGAPPSVRPRTRRQAGEVHVELPADDGAVTGQAEVSAVGDDVGVVWWLEVDPAQRRSGHGRQLLRAARHALAELGATRSVLVVDHDSPEERDRRPALSLYQSEGYEIVDHLWEYERGPV